MRKKEIFAIIMALALGMTAGCAPGDISRYAEKAQQAGEAIFEGKTVSVAADVSETAAAGNEAGSGTAENAGSGEAVKSGSAQAADDERAEGADAEAKPETGGAEASGETEGTGGTEEAGETEGSGGAEVSGKTDEEMGAETSGAAEMEAGSITDAGSADDFPAMMTAVPERVQSALAERAELVQGVLVGSDPLTEDQQDALSAVLAQQIYHDKTLCLINSAAFEGQEMGSFLLLADSTALTARGKVSGDLWYYAGKKAVRVLKNTEFTQLAVMQCGGSSFLLTQTTKDDETAAQVYRIQNGRAAGCFSDAVSIEREGDGLRVSYTADHVQYDPVKEEWSGTGAWITYFYVWGENGFVQESIRELTAEQYLAYIPEDESSAETRQLLEELEEKFYGGEAATECRYSFFAMGNDRIGYRECRIGLSEQQADENGHVAAEYTYHLVKLENGRLTPQCETLSGSGYYFSQWDQKEEELQKLSAIPAAYLKNRIDRAGRTLQPRERAALQCVQAVEEYDTDGLCFVEQADYDGNGETESFVAVGRYDGILDGVICDLWFVAGEEPVLLEEKLPVKNVLSFETGGVSLFLLEGFEADGARDRLYGVKEAAPQRCLENAFQIEVEENGDLTALVKGEEKELPYFYHILNGEVAEYGVQEKEPEILLHYENGKAVYKRLQRLAVVQEGELSCLLRENGLIHVMLTDKNGSVSYETYRVQNDALVLIDCGDGGYEAAGQEPAEAENVDSGTEEAGTEGGAKAGTEGGARAGAESGAKAGTESETKAETETAETDTSRTTAEER